MATEKKPWVPRPLDNELMAHIGAVAGLCRSGALECPPDSQGGYSVSWMRRQLLGLAPHQRVSDRRLRFLMHRKGFEQRCRESCVYVLRERGADGGQS